MIRRHVWLIVALVFALASVTVAQVSAATASEPYDHPCTSDEFIDETGECVHVDEIVRWATGEDGQ